MAAWNGWYHITGNTYGAWLPGDPRGWKTRRARPQPGADESISPEDGDRLLRHSQKILSREPIALTPEARQIVLTEMLAAFAQRNVEVAVFAVSSHHFHALARIGELSPRVIAGVAKRRSARALSSAGITLPGGVWAVRTHCKPIRDRAHQLEAARYIAAHTAEGAAVWTVWSSE